MVIDVVANMIVSKCLYSHYETNDPYCRQGKSEIKLPLYFRHNVRAENWSKYLNKTNKDLIEVDIYSKFVQTQQSSIKDKLYDEVY